MKIGRTFVRSQVALLARVVAQRAQAKAGMAIGEVLTERVLRSDVIGQERQPRFARPLAQRYSHDSIRMAAPDSVRNAAARNQTCGALRIDPLNQCAVAIVDGNIALHGDGPLGCGIEGTRRHFVC